MNILFLCMNMDNGFHGSTMHVLEYAEYFSARNDKVHIAAVFISDELRLEAKKYGIRVWAIDEIRLDVEYDIVFAFHNFIFPALVQRGLKYRHVIASVLSKSQSVEILPPTEIWSQFDLITAISDEIIAMYKNRFGINSGIFTKIPNHIPLAFLKYAHAKKEWKKTPEKICVVSNHYVEELAGLAGQDKIKIDFFGHEYGNNIRMSPEIILNYDVVITIGKTVQYALGLGVPAFEYDKFGGCGYITKENLDYEAVTNFSGRGTKIKMTPARLQDSIMSAYPEACADAPVLRGLALRRFAITSLIQKQLELLNTLKKEKSMNVDAALFANTCDAALYYILRSVRQDNKG